MMQKLMILLILLTNIFANEKNDKTINPIISMGLSAIVPGTGQFLNGEWKKGLFFLGIEILSFNKKKKYKNSGEQYISSYQNFAEEHWFIDKWLKDYYLFNSANSPVYPAYVDYGDDGLYCQPDGSYCSDDVYQPPWEGHGPDFVDGNESYTYKNISDQYRSVCQWEIDNGGSCQLYIPDLDDFGNPKYTENGNQIFVMPWGEMSTDENGNHVLNSNGDVIPDFSSLEVMPDHDLYEGIGKYPEFFSGWDDALEGSVWLEIRAPYEVPLTNNKVEYQNLRNKSNREFDKEEIFLSLIFANHAISMFDAFLTSVKRLRKIEIDSNLKYGYNGNFYLNGIEVSINW